MIRADKSLVQRMVDFRNRAEELRIIAENMHEEAGLLMFSAAASYDRAAETAQWVLRLDEAKAPPPTY